MAVCKVKTILVATSALLAALACQTTGANTLYQWTDQSGVITYSPTPPPESSGIEVKVVNLNKGGEREIQGSNASVDRPISPANSKESPDKLTVGPSLAATTGNQQKVKREQRSADAISKKSISTRCQDLANRITALESRMSLVDNAQDLNKTMLLLSRYQKSHDLDCEN